MPYSKRSIKLHRKLKGKIHLSSKIKVSDKEALSTLYTPGVGSVSALIAKEKELSWEYTGRKNTIAIVTDGTAVLGLGNIGPEAALPVMEGKSALFSEFGQVNAYPLCLNAPETDQVVDVVRAIAPSIGGVNLEDIAAPKCFEVEEQLSDLGIPVFHDDQDGAAIVALAALYNACKVLGKNMGDLRVVIMGAGAAGSAIAWLLMGKEKWQPDYKSQCLFFEPPKDIIMVNSKGIISTDRPLNPWLKMLAEVTNKENRKGDYREALKGADVFIGVSTGGQITREDIALMNLDPIIFALANPIPEIMPDEAKKGGAALVATGRSDFANQVNNALAFPGLFRGLLDSGVDKVSLEIKLAVAWTIASLVKPNKEKILPSIFDKKVHKAIAKAITKTQPFPCVRKSLIESSLNQTQIIS